jgi:hypothetical protein
MGTQDQAGDDVDDPGWTNLSHGGNTHERASRCTSTSSVPTGSVLVLVPTGGVPSGTTDAPPTPK